MALSSPEQIALSRMSDRKAHPGSDCLQEGKHRKAHLGKARRALGGAVGPTSRPARADSASPHASWAGLTGGHGAGSTSTHHPTLLMLNLPSLNWNQRADDKNEIHIASRIHYGIWFGPGSLFRYRPRPMSEPRTDSNGPPAMVMAWMETASTREVSPAGFGHRT